MLKSLVPTTSGTHTSVKRYRIPGGKSFFPTSVAGFIAANKRNPGCLSIGFESPRSASTSEAEGDSRREISRCNVSGEAKLTSSSKIQHPCRIARTRGPSSNRNAASPPPVSDLAAARRCLRNLFTCMAHASHASRKAGGHLDGSLAIFLDAISAARFNPAPSFSYCPASRLRRTASKNFTLAAALNVCGNSSWASALCSSTATLLTGAGRYPPIRSEASDCAFRLTTRSFAPTAAASA